jgi:hypothetical protein
MADSGNELILTITPLPDVDEQELVGLTRQLRTAVLESDAEAVAAIRGNSAPNGARGDPFTLAGLAVLIAPKAIDGLIQIVRDWVSRHDRATVTVKKGDAELTITGQLSKEQEQVTANLLKQLKD